MNFDPLSFAIGKQGNSGPVRDVISYLIGRAVGSAGEIWQTLTNVAVATFTAVSATLRDLAIDVTAAQSGSGDPSPSNVRPIIGWTGANIVVSPTLDAQDGTTYPVSWQTEAGTVYGGTLNVLTGVLTVTHILAAVRWGDSSGTTYGDYVRKDFAGAFTEEVDYSVTVNTTICINNVGANYRSNATADELHYYIRNGTDLRVFLPSTTDDDFVFQATGYLMVPQTFTIPAASVQALIGQNNIFADTGNINTITFRTH